MNQRGQVTLLMVAGFAILVLASIYFIMASNVREQKTQETITLVETAPFEIDRIEKYVTACLDTASRKALQLLTTQGATVYQSQAGPIPDPLPANEGRLFVSHHTRKVTYLFHPPRFVPAPYSPTLPLYPHSTFPYLGSTIPNFTGYFGLSSLPALYAKDGPNSIEYQLEYTIKNLTTQCLDFSIFEAEGVVVTPQKPEVNLVIAQESLKVQLSQHLDIVNEVTGETATLHQFRTELRARLGKIYDLVDTYLTAHQSSINTSIDLASQDFSIQLLSGVYEQDDVIIIRDLKENIKGRPVEFWFGVRNRPPALYYHDITNVSVRRGTNMTQSLAVASIGNLQGIDPDKDGLRFTIRFPFMPNQPNLTTSSTVIGFDTTMRVQVSDGEYDDYQDIGVSVYDAGEQNECVLPSGCYDSANNRLNRGQIASGEFGSYVHADSCIEKDGCVCDAPQPPIADADQSQSACLCVQSARWSGSSCCGDDINDCGTITNGQFCFMDRQNRGSLRSSQQHPLTAFELGCAETTVFSTGPTWITCDDDTLVSTPNADFGCVSEGSTKGWYECCGEDICQGKGSINRLRTGDSVIIKDSTRFCSSSKRFEFTADVDQQTCTGAGMRWSGSTCCEENEYYSDSQGCFDGGLIAPFSLVNSNIYYVDNTYFGCGTTPQQKTLINTNTNQPLLVDVSSCTFQNGWSYYCDPSGVWRNQQFHNQVCLDTSSQDQQNQDQDLINNAP